MSVVAQQIVDMSVANGASSTPPRVRTSGVVPALKSKRGLPPPAITATSLSARPLAHKAALGGQPPPLARSAKDPAPAKPKSRPVVDPEEDRDWQLAIARAHEQLATEQRAAEQQATKLAAEQTAAKLAADQLAAAQRAVEQDERDWQLAIAEARARVAQEEREWSKRIARARSEPSSFILDAPSRPPAKLPGTLHFWP